MNKYIDKCGYSSVKIYLIFACIFLLAIFVASTWTRVNKMEGPIEQEPPIELTNEQDSLFVPTAEDIEAQDSIWVIVNQTSLEVDTIHQHIDQIILKIDDIMDRMEMDCGDTTSYNSIDISYPDEHVMWIGDNGDTIWE